MPSKKKPREDQTLMLCRRLPLVPNKASSDAGPELAGSGSHKAMESPKALMCPLEKGVRGIETSGSGYLRQEIHGGRKGRAERQGLEQSPNERHRLGGLR